MLTKLFGSRRKPSDQPVTVVPSKYPIAKSGADLLNTKGRLVLIRQIKRSFSVTEAVWIEHYLYAIEQFAELVQEVPASEIHHHSTAGGLIDHTLEALYAGVRIAQGFVLPPNSEPEDISKSSDRWRFGAFIAILAHDIGKIVTDIEIVYRPPGSEFQAWHPWFDNLPPGAQYSYRYKQKIANSKVAKSLHEKASMSLLPKLLTRKATIWLFDDAELLSQLFSTITHATFGGQAIAEIVRAADAASVATNLGADTGRAADHSNAIPLHEKLIVSLRKLIADGELKRNKPGAAMWVTASETWVVSKATMEAVQAQLLNEGHRGIPKSVVRLFETLREHELLIPNVEGDSVWIAEIHDFPKDWTQKLTFLRFKNELLWPTSNPDLFDGTVTPLDKKGNQIVESRTESAGVGESDKEIASPPGQTGNPAKPQESKPPDATKTAVSRQPRVAAVQSTAPKPLQTAPRPLQTAPKSPAAKADTPRNSPSGPAARSRKVDESVLLEHDFFAWLLRGIANRTIRVNEPAAPVHVLDDHVALVSPLIFRTYFDKFPFKRKTYENKTGSSQAFMALQKEIEAFDIHKKSINGQNIAKMIVEGTRSKATLSVYLLNRKCFPSLKNFSANKAMTLEL